MAKYYFVYIMTNKNNTVLYTGVTNNIIINKSNNEWKDLWDDIKG